MLFPVLFLKWGKRNYALLILIILVVNYLLLYFMRQPTFKESEDIEESELKTTEHILINDVAKTPIIQPLISKEIPSGESNASDFKIAILVMACNRTSVSRCIDSILRARNNDSRFPVIVSQDCIHKDTEDVIRGYKDVFFMQQPNQTEAKLDKKKLKLRGYFRIARHYKWALNKVFREFNFTSCIVIEDDLEVSQDIFEYFLATLPLLKKDRYLYCVSAWNDNGKLDVIDSTQPGLIHRTDFFPGLGWMLLRSLWDELEPDWPDGFWDDWMRSPKIRKNRSCLRPEVSRTETFGKKGVSNGLHFKNHLQHIKKFDGLFPFTKYNLSYLLVDSYEEFWLRKVYLSPELTIGEVLASNDPTEKSARISYNSKEQFKIKAKKFNIMADFKSGIPRTAYRGIVPFMFFGRQVYLSPKYDWSGYNESWN